MLFKYDNHGKNLISISLLTTTKQENWFLGMLYQTVESILFLLLNSLSLKSHVFIICSNSISLYQMHPKFNRMGVSIYFKTFFFVTNYNITYFEIIFDFVMKYVPRGIHLLVRGNS